MTYEISLQERDEAAAAAVRAVVPHDGIAGFIGGAFADVLAVLATQHMHPVGPPFARYWDQDGSWDVEAGFPTSAPVAASGRVRPTTLPGGTVATTMHVGSYEGLGGAYGAVTEWLTAQGMRPSDAPWESYLDGPDAAAPRTLVCFPCVAAES